MHPFKDKLFVFIGQPTRCSRQAARDALNKVGGVTEERITTFTSYIVAFNGAEKTKAYQKAEYHDKYGHMVLLTEEQFFNVLEGKANPPEKKVPPNFKGAISIPAKYSEERERDSKRVEQYVVEKKRLKSMEKHGTPTKDGRVRFDFDAFHALYHMAEVIKNKKSKTVYNENYNALCDNCRKPSRVRIGNDDGSTIANLCLDCHNHLMAELTDTEYPKHIPKHLSFENDNGEIRNFEVEFNIYQSGKIMTATEIGREKRIVDVHGELDDDFMEMLETLSERIKKSLSVTYIEHDGYITNDKAVGYIQYNHEREACDIIIDGKPYTWSELEKNISAREGWKIKIEFGDIGDELD